MGLTDLLFKKQKLQVGLALGKPPLLPLPALVEFDASVSETHTDEVEVTEHPVEEGSDITDHIRKLPVTITVEGKISNNPIVFLASVQAPSPIVGDLIPTYDRVETAYAKLRELQSAGVLVDVITSLRTYANMAIVTIGVQRDASNGNALSCVMTLREVKLAKALTIDLPLPNDNANKKPQNTGQKPKTDSTTVQTQQSQSMLSSITSGLFGG